MKTIGKMALNLGVDTACGAFFAAIATKVMPANAAVGVTILVATGGVMTGMAVSKIVVNEVEATIGEISESMAKIREQAAKQKEAEA